jgi:hypothetical protein
VALSERRWVESVHCAVLWSFGARIEVVRWSRDVLALLLSLRRVAPHLVDERQAACGAPDLSASRDVGESNILAVKTFDFMGQNGAPIANGGGVA